MPEHTHRHPRVKHAALRTLALAAIVSFRLIGPLIRERTTRTRVALIANGDLLLIQNITNFRKWTLPGGGYHKGETGIDCARRELREEIGVKLPANKFTAAGHYTETQRGTTYHYDTFIVEVDARPPIKITWELAHATWAPLASLPTNISTFIPHMLREAGKL